MNQNVFIIGPMGAGKSSVGLQLAKILKLKFYDSDRELEQKTGVDLEWMFDIEGEEGYHQREQTIIDELTQKKGIVLATGGGAICSETNRSYLSARGIVVFLSVSFEQQIDRVNRLPSRRPMLNVDNKLEKLNELNKIRLPLYQSIADLFFINSANEPHNLAKEIARDVLKFVNNS